MESKFLVDGIMCPNCVAKVTKALTAVDGVEQVSVSEDYKTVTVLHAESVSAGAMKNAIEGITERKFTVTGHQTSPRSSAADGSVSMSGSV